MDRKYNEFLELDLPEILQGDTTVLAPDIVNYWRLEQNRIFYVDDEITEDIMELQRSIIWINMVDKDIEPEKRIPIKIYINSPGGYLCETNVCLDTIMLSKTPVYTINLGMAYSGGCLLLLAGHKRFAMKKSFAMFHSGSGGTQGTFEQQEEAQKVYKKQVTDMGTFILERTSIEDKLFKKNKTKDWYFDSDEQVKYGLVHKIVDDLDEII